ncbi:MAG: hypothetical protein HYW45_02450 [Candidatus Daviesbacteria bacterium]|nr:MAG: hypothetical protein HYW45_02450 [Candidatus Daviesbacteria bacterium]
MPKLRFGLPFIFYVILVSFIYLVFIPKDIYALIYDCAAGESRPGYCNANPDATKFDCGFGIVGFGQNCCDAYAAAEGPGVTATCSDFCAVGDLTCSTDSQGSCLNSSCLGSAQFCCNYSNPAPPPTPAPVCDENLDCVDGNPCTEDTCNNPGTSSASCSNTNSPAGKICDQNTGATCDGNGNCIQPEPTPTCSSSNCGACNSCSSCIANVACGWNGSSCQNGTASCPAGTTQWYWDSCTTNVCQAPSPSSPPSGSVCGNNICEANEDYNNCRADCDPPAPSLSSFSGAACYSNPYSATLSWSGVSLPSSDSGCPNGYWVDISTNSSFSGYSNKCIQGTSLTTNGSEGWSSNGNFSFNAGSTYWARVYNGSHSNSRSWAVPTGACSASCSLTSSCSGSTCTFNTTYTINNQSQSGYQVNLHPDVNNFSVQSGWQANGPINHTYTSGSYTARAEVKKNDGTSPVTCDKSVTIASWNPPQCSASKTFAGCSTGSNSRCSDYGNSSYSNWNQNLWNTCNDVCNRQNPNTYCAGTPTCSVNVGTVTRNSSGYNNTAINWNTTNMGGSKVWYYNSGTCSGSSCPSSGWSQITSVNFDSNNSYNWNPNGVAPSSGGTRTVGVSDPNNVLRCTWDVSFPPPSSGCSLSASPAQSNQPTTSTLTASVNVSDMPGSKLSQWDLDGNGSFETQDTKLSNSVFVNKTTTYSFRVVDGAKSSGQQGYVLSGPCSADVTIGQNQPGPGGGSGGSCNAPYSCMNGVGSNCYEGSQTQINYCKSIGYNTCANCQSLSSSNTLPIRIKVVQTTNSIPPTPWPQCSYPTTLEGCLDKNGACVAQYYTSNPGQCYVPVVSESGPVSCPSEENGYSYCGTGNPGPNSSCAFEKQVDSTCYNDDNNPYPCKITQCFLRNYGDITTCQGASYSMACFGTDIPNPVSKGVAGVKVRASCVTKLGKLGDEGASRQGITGQDGSVTIDVPYIYIEGSGGYNNVTCTARLADNPDNPPGLVWGTSRYWYNIVPVFHWDTGKTDPGGRIPIIASTISEILFQTYGPNANSYQIYNGSELNYLFVIKASIDPWIQTTGGDIYSNTINTPGGP